MAGIWCARIGDVLGAVHLTVFTLICSAWNQGWLRFRPARAIQWAAVTVVATAGTMFLNHAAIEATLEGQGTSRDLFRKMDRYIRDGESETLQEAPPRRRESEESILDRIRRTKALRVGFLAKEPPFSHPHASGHQVGLDIDLMQVLAVDLDARLELVRIDPSELKTALEQDRVDLVVGGVASTVRNVGLYEESQPYLHLHGALLVRDHDAPDYRTMDAILNRAAERPIRAGFASGGLMARTDQRPPGLELVELESLEAFVRGETDLDVALVSAESGAVITMLYPSFPWSSRRGSTSACPWSSRSRTTPRSAG